MRSYSACSVLRMCSVIMICGAVQSDDHMLINLMSRRPPDQFCHSVALKACIYSQATAGASKQPFCMIAPRQTTGSKKHMHMCTLCNVSS
jgi:hypothetical protein